MDEAIERVVREAGKPQVDPLVNLRCIVVVEAMTGLSDLEIIFANGDEGAGQVAAEKWCKANPGRRAWLMTATGPSPCIAEIKATWARQA